MHLSHYLRKEKKTTLKLSGFGSHSYLCSFNNVGANRCTKPAEVQTDSKRPSNGNNKMEKKP